jgi:N-acyl-D-aspartate/D-glutamate deacylase
MFDLTIRGATLYDGSGAPGVTADVAVRAGRIAQLGRVSEPAHRTVDASGLALMPGIIDLHTHYDAQITWDATLSPSPALGVTTAVMGNCGFGIAPCPPSLRDTMLKNLSVVEAMDLNALTAGVRWEFESFSEYMALLRRARPYANVAVLAGHSCIRTAVMGEEASTREQPTDTELARMRAMVREALAAGAIGFASSFSPNHSGYAGRPMPSTIASEEELRALVGELGHAGRGVFVMATGARATPDLMESMAADTGRPMFIVTVLTMYDPGDPQRCTRYYQRVAEALERGREVYIQTSCQPLSFDFTLRNPYPLLSHDAFDRVKSAPLEALPAIYADPAFRARFRENLARPRSGILFHGDWSTVEVGGTSIAALARAAGRDPLDHFFDLALADRLETQFVGKFFQNDDAGVAPLIAHRAGVIGLSDAGAHLMFMCDAGFGLYFLRHWVRETGAVALHEAVRRLTSDPAEKYRIADRGRVAPGAWADLLLFDPAQVGVSNLLRATDLPGGGARMLRSPLGVHGVWVNGVQVHDGKDYLALEAGPGAVLDRFGA